MTGHIDARRPRLGRATALTAAVIAIALAVNACSDAEPEPEPVPPETSSPSTPTDDPTPTQDPDAWRDKFKPAQLEAYDEALAKWQEYEARSEPIWAKGEATPAAEKLFKEYFPHPIWIDYWQKLKTYEAADVKTAGTPEVFWSRAKSITQSGSAVRIRQCIDYAQVKRTQGGEPIARPATKPQLRTLYLSQPDGYGWLIYGVVELTDGKPTPCEV